ncbi:hypothetical protein V5O48_001564 [Marasmius crinis-equi]|uniref:ASX DEUBAD domain-containing protein n=1 Tax=Marasmius crinis-equi TaxID=585013 RepID=A0ABR3FYL2_9AGAR
MAISSSTDMTQQCRPTLPSLHTLDLPTLSTTKPHLSGLPYALHDHGRPSRTIHAPYAHHQRPRQFSASSSRTPSPTLSDSGDRDTSFVRASTSALPTPSLPQAKQSNLRLVPCSSLEDADAVVFVPPRSLQGQNEQSSALLLVGPALNDLRHPQRKIAKGARIHPYKFARRSDTLRTPAGPSDREVAMILSHARFGTLQLRTFAPSSMSPAERPRRSTRKTTKLIEAEQEEKTAVASSSKRKAASTNLNNDDGEYELSDLLQYSKSVLTTMDISELINANTWDILSPESRARLAPLLPSSAFKGYKPTIGSEHPAYQDSSVSPAGPSSHTTDNEKNQRDPATVDPSFFNDLHFLAAARTFQDHIYSGWLTDEHKAKVAKWEQDVRDGKAAAPWKDEEWEKNAAEEAAEESSHANGTNSKTKAKDRPVSDVRLYELARHSVTQVGDVLSYKRHFNHLDLTIEKDVIVNISPAFSGVTCMLTFGRALSSPQIHSHNTRQQSLTIFLERGTTQHLPPTLLVPDPEPDPVGTTQSIEITSPTMLETAILDIDGRVGKDRRPNGNAWKCFTVWRWRDGAEGGYGGDERGGRENHGTLFYLRGSIKGSKIAQVARD